MYLTSADIESAKQKVKYSFDGKEVLHEDDDCIRIAYEWLDAQKTLKTSSPANYFLALKHAIERWGGRYVSQSDVEVAAYMHPLIKGKYPHFNISKKLILPSDTRLKNIQAAFSQNYRDSFDPKIYSAVEKQ